MEEWAKIPAAVCKPGQELQETSDRCNCKQRFLYLILSSIFLLYQILISCNQMEINYLKIIQCDSLDFFFDSVSHSWSVHMMKITDLSILCKWENLKSQILTLPSECCSRNRDSFQSSIVQFWWACVNCSFSFLFLADRSGTQCGLLLM